ncbi:MAG: IS630 family transposase [Magnetococcales bacterium]|nr:IS630 family transposase [Magnetococcales bacterium]
METFDGRKLDHKTLEQLRIRAVQRVLDGESPESVIKALGFTKPRIYEWLSKFREGGWDALKAKVIPGRPRKVTGAQMAWLYRTVVGTNPLQLRFPFALWTRGMVRELIRRELGITLSEVAVGRLLRTLGLTPQRPVRRAWQRDPVLVDEWTTKTLPEIQEMAKKANADLYFGDESSVRSDYHSGTTWAPIGQTPVVETTGARFKVNVVSAIDGRGSLRFMAFESKMDADQFITFLQRLIHNAERPIFLVLDNHPVHRSTKVRQFVESTNGKLRLFFQPPYSPQLNPAELVWNHLKHHGIGKTPIAGPDHLKACVISMLRSLQKLPAKVKGFFRHPDLRYIGV